MFLVILNIFIAIKFVFRKFGILSSMGKSLNILEWKNKIQGSILLGVWTGVFWSVTGLTLIHRHKKQNFLNKEKAIVSKIETSFGKEENIEDKKNKEEKMKKNVIKDVTKIVTKDKTVQLRMLILTLSIIIKLLVQIKVSKQIGKLGSLLAQRNWEALTIAKMNYALWTIPAALMNSFVDFAKTYLSISIRKKVSSVLKNQFINTYIYIYD